MRYRLALAIVWFAAVIQAGVGAQEATPNVRDYVREPASHDGGDLYREMKALYDSSVVPDLLEMLRSESEKAHWARIAGLLGVVGDERAVEGLIDFVERPVEEAYLSQDAHDARRAAITGLGYLINGTGSDRALTYLIDGLTPSTWRQRNVQGVAPWMTSYEENDLLLSEYALFGLALSGDPRAGDALRRLQRAPTAEQARFRASRDSTLTQWLEVHQLVADRGVAGMYLHYRAQQQVEVERRLQEIERLYGAEVARRYREAR